MGKHWMESDTKKRYLVGRNRPEGKTTFQLTNRGFKYNKCKKEKNIPSNFDLKKRVVG